MEITSRSLSSSAARMSWKHFGVLPPLSRIFNPPVSKRMVVAPTGAVGEYFSLRGLKTRAPFLRFRSVSSRKFSFREDLWQFRRAALRRSNHRKGASPPHRTRKHSKFKDDVVSRRRELLR